jgi:TP901 family phage tail tape measure protein
MATAVVDTMVVKLLGDGSSYQKMLRQAVKTTERTTKRIRQSLTRLGRSLSLSLTAPLSIIGGVAVKSFADFDKAMTESTAIMKTTESQISRMRETALSLSTSGDVAKGPRDLAEAYFFLASANFDAEQSMAALPAVARFATAGAFDMATATDLLTDAQTALGLSTKDPQKNLKNLVRISDALVKANTSANASVKQFSEALTSDAATAGRNMGQSLETTLAALSAYAQKGKKGAEAGNLFGRATRLLTKSFRENGEVFKHFGIDVVDEATGEYKNFIDIIGSMEQAFKGMTKPQRDAALEQLGFAALAQKSITPLLGMTDAMKKWEEAQKSAAGFTKGVAEKQMKSFSNQMLILKNSLTVVAIEVGEILAPFILKLNDALTGVIASWKSLNPTIKKAAVFVGMFVAALGPVLVMFGAAVIAVGFFMTSLVSIASIIGPGGALAAAIAFIGTVILGLTISWEDALGAVKNFAVMAIGFIANFSENMQIAWKFISDNWKGMLMDMGAAAVHFIANALANLSTMISTMMSLYVAFQGFQITLFKRIFSFEFVDAVLTGIITAGEKIVEFGKFVWKTLQDAFKGKSPAGTFDTFVEGMKNDFEKGLSDGDFLKTAGDIIARGAKKLRSPLEGFESSIPEFSGFNLEFGTPDKPKGEALSGGGGGGAAGASSSKSGSGSGGLAKKAAKASKGPERFIAARKRSAEAATRIDEHRRRQGPGKEEKAQETLDRIADAVEDMRDFPTIDTTTLTA